MCVRESVCERERVCVCVCPSILNFEPFGSLNNVTDLALMFSLHYSNLFQNVKKQRVGHAYLFQFCAIFGGNY